MVGGAFHPEQGFIHPLKVAKYGATISRVKPPNGIFVICSFLADFTSWLDPSAQPNRSSPSASVN